MTSWAYDIDGTLLLCDTPGHVIPWTDPEKLRRLGMAHSEPARDQVRRLSQRYEASPIYITGRPELARCITLEQLDAAGLPNGYLFIRPNCLPFTWEAYIDWKANLLATLEPTAYVGDLEADEAAARRADVPFVPADLFRSATQDQLEDHLEQERTRLLADEDVVYL